MNPWPIFLPPVNGQKRYVQTVKLFEAAESMKKFGVRVDMRRVAAHDEDAARRGRTFEALFLEHTGLNRYDLGPSGAGQTDAVKDWFKEAGAPTVQIDKRTGKAQFNSAALTIWAKDYPGAPFSQPAAALLGLRKATTARRFLNTYRSVAHRYGGRIHFGFNPLGTKTGRWSASQSWSWRDGDELKTYKLNAQNVPSKNVRFTFEGEGELAIMVSLRDCFIPDKGCVWIKADYEALEARLIAYVTGASKLASWIAEGKDIHMEHARALFPAANIPLTATKADKQYKPYREAAKPCMYGFTYQAPSDRGTDKYPECFKTLKQIFPSLDERYFKTIVERFFALHPEIRDWQRSVGEKLKRQGSIIIPQSGRRLYYPPSMRGRNQAQNVYFQSGGAELINQALVTLSPLTAYKSDKTAILLQVHDEFSCQAEESHVDSYCQLIEECMAQPLPFGSITAGVPASADTGPNWGETKERA